MKIKKLAIKSHDSRATPGKILTYVYKYINFTKVKDFLGLLQQRARKKISSTVTFFWLILLSKVSFLAGPSQFIFSKPFFFMVQDHLWNFLPSLNWNKKKNQELTTNLQ